MILLIVHNTSIKKKQKKMEWEKQHNGNKLPNASSASPVVERYIMKYLKSLTNFNASTESN